MFTVQTLPVLDEPGASAGPSIASINAEGIDDIRHLRAVDADEFRADLSIVDRLTADRQQAFRSTAALGQPDGHRSALSYDTVLRRSFAPHRPRRPVRGRRWPT